MMPAIGDGAPVSCGMTVESRVNKTMATTMPASHPIKNPTLVPFARGDSNIKIAAMIGIGLTAIPTANGRISPITSVMRYPQEWQSLTLGPPARPPGVAAHGPPLSKHRSPPVQQGSRVLRLSWQPQPERAAIAARRGNAPR